jgi:hypothetical protein
MRSPRMLARPFVNRIVIRRMEMQREAKFGEFGFMSWADYDE